MKIAKTLLAIVAAFVLSTCFHFAFSNGLCIVNVSTGSHLELVSTHTSVVVNDQVATVTTVQTFRNNLGASHLVKFGFPLSSTASATSLRWKYAGNWYSANFSPMPQDTTLPGGGGNEVIEANIRNYLGDNPLYFDLLQSIAADSLLTVELTYVDLLPYAFNRVSFEFPGNYSAFQSDPLESQVMVFELNSQRTIDQLGSESHPNASVDLQPYHSVLNIQLFNQPANKDISIYYQLNANELGLFGFSTFLPDSSATCDDAGHGFFAFIVEPDPSDNTETIDKVFTLIIDRSGSMAGNKIIQARNAATFIVNNLNVGDYFNIVAFDATVISFRPDHVPFTVENQQAALQFIAGLTANSSTNISGAFTTAISQFQGSSTQQANIIIFFTDGEATAGITNTPDLLNHVHNLINSNSVEGLSVFTFGIGSYVNTVLLNELAVQNNGFAQFLGNEELEAVISHFYLTVRNPVLLQTSMSFDPDIIVETYPAQLPNLYKGQQLIVVGRYSNPGTVNINFSGQAFGQPVSYDYSFDLADTSVANMQFLPRLWSKKKIESLYTQYLSTQSGSPAAMAIEEEIVGLSLCYGVISPFTSFEDNTGGGGSTGVNEFDSTPEAAVQSLLVTPNPFRTETWLRLPEGSSLKGTVWMAIYDIHGRLVRMEELLAGDIGMTEWLWDGKDSQDRGLLPGVYTVRMFNEQQVFMAQVVKL